MDRKDVRAFSTLAKQSSLQLARALASFLGTNWHIEAELLAEICERDFTQLLGLVSQSGYVCNDVDEAHLRHLLRLASATTPLDGQPQIVQVMWAKQREGNLSQSLSGMQRFDLVKVTPTLWRFTPKNSKSMSTVSMKGMESELKKLWIHRILSSLLQFRSRLPAFAEFGDTTADQVELHDLFGKLRWGSLQASCRSLERFLKAVPHAQVPFTSEDIRFYLNALRVEDAKPYLVKNFFGMVCTLSKICGFHDVSKNSALQQKKDAIVEAISADLYTGSQRANAIPRAVLELMVKFATQLPLFADRFLLRHVLCLICFVARYGDGQHISPGKLRREHNGLAAEAWATKVSGNGKSKGVLPFWAPDAALPSYDGDLWGDYLQDHIRIGHMDRDFLLPRPNPTRTGFVMAPCPNSTALRWLRAVLQLCGVGESLLPTIVLASFRVTIPDIAYQCEVPSTVRVYLGRWSSDSMADRYTREHRSACQRVWNAIQPAMAANPTIGSNPIPFEFRCDGHVPQVLEQSSSCKRSRVSECTVSSSSLPSTGTCESAESSHSASAQSWDVDLARVFLSEESVRPYDIQRPLVINIATGKVHIAAKSDCGLLDHTEGCQWYFKEGSVELVPPANLQPLGTSVCRSCFRRYRNSPGDSLEAHGFSDDDVSDMSSVGSSDSEALGSDIARVCTNSGDASV